MNYFLTRMLILLGLAFSTSVLAQDNLDVQTTIDSTKLQSIKNISIRLPQDYYEKQTSHVSYPVLYFLDAGRADEYIHAEISTLSASGIIPDFIVVGIKRDGKNRYRDFTPVTNEENKGGGADDFVHFIEHELIPYIDNNYRTADFRILQGHSLGGLFSLHAFQAKPKLFQAHFAFSPSLYWADSSVTQSVKKYVASANIKQSYLYANMGNEGLGLQRANGIAMREGFIEISRLLQYTNKKSFRHNFELFEEDPHHLTQFTGMRRALRDLYKNWYLAPVVSLQGVTAFKAHFDRLSTQFGYKVTPQEGTIYWAGVANERMFGNRKTALPFFKLYVELYPNSVNALESLADFYKDDGDLEKAIPLINKALTLVSKTDDKYLSLFKKDL